MFSPPMHVSVFTAGLHDLSGGRARWAFSRQAKAGFLGNLNIFDICNILISCLVYATWANGFKSTLCFFYITDAWWEHNVFETLSRKYKFQKAFSFYSNVFFYIILWYFKALGSIYCVFFYCFLPKTLPPCNGGHKYVQDIGYRILPTNTHLPKHNCQKIRTNKNIKNCRPINIYRHAVEFLRKGFSSGLSDYASGDHSGVSSSSTGSAIQKKTLRSS